MMSVPSKKGKTLPDMVQTSTPSENITQYRSEERSPRDEHFISKGDHGIISEESN